MTIFLNDCSPAEAYVFYAGAVFLFATSFTTMQIYHRKHQEEQDSKFRWTSLLGFFEIFLTDQGLNQKGKYWRKWFIFSFTLLAIDSLIVFYFDICKP